MTLESYQLRFSETIACYRSLLFFHFMVAKHDWQSVAQYNLTGVSKLFGEKPLVACICCLNANLIT